MSDVFVVESPKQVVEDDPAELAGFAEGYDEKPAPRREREPVAAVEKPTAEPAKEPAKVETAAAPPEKPKYARVLQQDWDNLKAAAGKVSNLESQLAKLAGSAPNAEKIAQQVMDLVRSQNPAGMTVEMSDEDFAELAADFPELAKHTRASLERIFKKANVKGTGPATPPPETVDVGSVAEQVKLRLEEDTLKRTYPDWTEIVGRPPNVGDPIPESNPFRQWLSQQNAAYQKAVNETNSHADIQEAIAHFKASQTVAPQTAPVDRTAARRAVIEQAVQPSGDGQAPPPKQPKSVHDAFNEGYRDG